MQEQRRVYLEDDLELFIRETKKRIHILVFSHYDWSIKNYQILNKAKDSIPRFSHWRLF